MSLRVLKDLHEFLVALRAQQHGCRLAIPLEEHRFAAGQLHGLESRSLASLIAIVTIRNIVQDSRSLVQIGSRPTPRSDSGQVSEGRLDTKLHALLKLIVAGQSFGGSPEAAARESRNGPCSAVSTPHRAIRVSRTPTRNLGPHPSRTSQVQPGSATNGIHGGACLSSCHCSALASRARPIPVELARPLNGRAVFGYRGASCRLSANAHFCRPPSTAPGDHTRSADRLLANRRR